MYDNPWTSTESLYLPHPAWCVTYHRILFIVLQLRQRTYIFAVVHAELSYLNFRIFHRLRVTFVPPKLF